MYFIYYSSDQFNAHNCHILNQCHKNNKINKEAYIL